MNEFQRIKQDHFQVIPYTKKQLTDWYNTIHNTSFNEENLVFEKSATIYLAVGASVNLPNRQFGVINCNLASFDNEMIITNATVNINVKSNSGNNNTFNNAIFNKLKNVSGNSLTFCSIFKFV